VSKNRLAGFRVLVTRPAEQAGPLIDAIEAEGGQAIRFPVIQIVGRDPRSVESDFEAIPPTDIAIFISRNAALHGQVVAAKTKPKPIIAAIGPTTAAMLEKLGSHVDVVPTAGFNSERLLAEPALCNVAGKNVTIVRGEQGREAIGRTLTRRGATVNYLPVYRRTTRTADADELQVIERSFARKEVDCITVMSVQTLENLLSQLSATAIEHMHGLPLVAPGARVIQTASRIVPGMIAIPASGPRVSDILKAVIAARQSGHTT